MKIGNVFIWLLVFLVMSSLVGEVDGFFGLIGGLVAKGVNGIANMFSSGGKKVKESSVSTAKHMNLVGHVASLSKNLFSQRQQVSSNRDNIKLLEQKIVKASMELASKEDLEPLMQKTLESNLKLDRLNFDLKNVVSNQLQLKTVAGKTFGILNDVSGTTAEINQKVDDVVRLGERQEALQVQQLAALSQVDTQVSDANHKLDISLASIYGLDEQLGKTKKTVDEINGEVAQSNIRLGQLHEISMDIVASVGQMNTSLLGAMHSALQKTSKEFDMLHEKLDTQMETLDKWIENLGDELKETMGHVKNQLTALGKKISVLFANVFHKLVEQNTKAARECYRRIREKLLEKLRYGAIVKGKPNLVLLMNPQYGLTNKNLQMKMMSLQEYLKDPITGVERCWNELRAIVDPAIGFGTDNKDLFGDLYTIFLTEYPNASSWTEPGAIKQLKGMSMVRDQILVQMDDLYTWWSLSEVGDVVNAANKTDIVIPQSTLTIRLERLMVKYGEGVKNLKDRHNKQFSSCIAPTAQLEALSNLRMKCDRDLDDIFDNKTGHRAVGLEAGTECTFLCLESSFKPKPLICGPAGQWSVNVSVFSETLIKCNQLSLGINDIKGYMENSTHIVITKMINMGQKIGAVKADMDGINTKIKGMEANMDGINTKIKGMEANMDRINTKIKGMEASMERIITKINGMDFM